MTTIFDKNRFAVISAQTARTWLKDSSEAIDHAETLLNKPGNDDVTFLIVQVVGKVKRKKEVPPIEVELYYGD